MANGLESLVSLDSFTSEKALRVAVYTRARRLKFHGGGTTPDSVEEIAERLIAFVGAERWRLDALDAVMEGARRLGIDGLLERAGEIAEWVEREAVAESPPVAEVASTSASTSKVTTRKKKGATKKTT